MAITAAGAEAMGLRQRVRAPPGRPGWLADPGGGITLMDAMDKQIGIKMITTKRPVPVLVIDHIEQKPTDN